MKNKNQIVIKSLALLTVFLTFSGCPYDQQPTPAAQLMTKGAPTKAKLENYSEHDLQKMDKDQLLKILRQRDEEQVIQPIVDMSKSLSFSVKNSTGKDLYVTCFSYIKNNTETSWRWDKSDVYLVKTKQERLVILDQIPDIRDLTDTFGYLGVFDTKKEADRATYQLTPDNKLIDLDLLKNIKSQTVNIKIAKYGILGNRIDYKLEHSHHNLSEHLNKPNPELDLHIENKTGKDLLLTLFIYEQNEATGNNYALWTYTKSKVVHAKNNQSVIIDVPTIFDRYKWEYMRAVLGVFDARFPEKAEQATFELTDKRNLINLGLLASYLGQKVTLDVEHYGVEGDFIDFVIKPLNKQPKKYKAW